HAGLRDEVLVEQVVDAAVDGEPVVRLPAGTEVEGGAVLVVAHGRAADAADIGDQRVAVAVVAAFADQTQADAIAGLPGQVGVGHVLGRVARDRLATGSAAGLLALGEGVVAAQLQPVQQVDLAGQFDATGLGLVDVHALAEGAVAQRRPAGADVHAVAAIGRRHLAVGEDAAAGDLVVELVEERGGVDVPALAFVVGGHFIVGAGFRLEVRRADQRQHALAAEADHAGEQLVRARGLVAGADAALDRPSVVGFPHQVGARAGVAAKDVVVVVTH